MFTKLKGKSGFTLTELMVAIALVAVLAAIVTPFLEEWLQGYRLKSAARAVYSDLQWAKMRAVSQNLEHRLVFLNNTQYQVETGDRSSNSNWPGTVEGIVRDFGDRDNPYYYSKVTFNSNNNPVFQPKGTAIPGATITLTNGTENRTVTVVGTGHITIQ